MLLLLVNFYSNSLEIKTILRLKFIKREYFKGSIEIKASINKAANLEIILINYRDNL
jgi:hypothetical protein